MLDVSFCPPCRATTRLDGPGGLGGVGTFASLREFNSGGMIARVDPPPKCKQDVAPDSRFSVCK